MSDAYEYAVKSMAHHKHSGRHKIIVLCELEISTYDRYRNGVGLKPHIGEMENDYHHKIQIHSNWPNALRSTYQKRLKLAWSDWAA